jgi:hypothetical protein
MPDADAPQVEPAVLRDPGERIVRDEAGRVVFTGWTPELAAAFQHGALTRASDLPLGACPTRNYANRGRGYGATLIRVWRMGWRWMDDRYRRLS